MWQPYLHLWSDIIPPSAICLYQLLSAGCDCRDLVYASSLLCYSYWRTNPVRLFSCAVKGNTKNIFFHSMSPCCLFFLILECPSTLSDWRIKNCFVIRRHISSYIVHDHSSVMATGSGSKREKLEKSERHCLTMLSDLKKKKSSSTYGGLITAQVFKKNSFQRGRIHKQRWSWK